VLYGTHLPQGGTVVHTLFGPCIVAKLLDWSRCHLVWR